MTASPSDSHRHERRQKAGASRVWIPMAVIAFVIGCAFVSIYVGLQREPTPDGLPLSVVGGGLSRAVASELGDAVDVRQVPDTGAGESAVREGEAVGVLSADGAGSVSFDYAGASGMSEVAAARRLIGGFAEQAGVDLSERDIVPLATYDTAGLSTFYLVFGVTLGSFVLAQSLTGATALLRLRHRLALMSGFAVVIGLVAAAIAGPLYGSLTPSFPELALTLVLLSAACAFVTKALGVWLGPPGIGLAVLLLTVIGNATSGATIGFNLLPAWARAVSAEMPQGAATRALNGLGYYDGQGVARHLLMLFVWFVAGLGLVLLRHRRDTRDVQSATSAEPGRHRVTA